MLNFNSSTPRRSFFGNLFALGATVAGVGALKPTAAAAETPSGHLPGGPDNRWLDSLRARYKTTFDVETHKNGNALVQGKNFLDNWRDAYNVPETDVNLVMAVRGTGIPIVLTDAIWKKYKIGEQYGIVDPATKAPSERNLYIKANVQRGGPVTAEQTVEALQARGARFLVCMNTIHGATKMLVAAGMGTTEQIRSSLLGGIIPGVVIVPAMVIAFTLMEEKGVAYVYAG